MPPFPTRSRGVLLSSLAERWIAYDLVTETAHQLNASAGTLLAACGGAGDVDQAIDAWAHDANLDREQVASDVVAGLAMLGELALVGRDEPVDAPKPVVGSTADDAVDGLLGAVHPVIDHRIAFRGPERKLLDTIDTFLGTGLDAHVADGAKRATTFFDVHIEADGQVVLNTDYEWKFPSLEAFLRQLTSVLNEYAVWTHSCAAFHAGAVRSPDGEVVLLPAPSGDGKSTITGAFVAAGWAYLGDEAIGVRPDSMVAVGYPKRLAIGPESRAALKLPESSSGDLDPADLRADVVRLDGDVGPVSRVLLPRYEAGAEVTMERLEPHEAVVELLANTLNLARAGQSALDAVCDLATSVPVDRLVHGDVHWAVAHV